MYAITAVVLGGVSLSGGQGRVSQVMIGVLIMGVLSTGMIMLGINDYVQQLIKGLVLDCGCHILRVFSQDEKCNFGREIKG